MYSGFENLYFNVEMNLGLISRAKDLTSYTHLLRSSKVYPEKFTIFLVHPVVFFNCVADRINEAAAICEGLN
jgi:hypothetical protein